ncbi:MAG: flagellar basal body P-ring formation chaperone FlgA [Gemmatimonadaceae bacterium]|jgi:flagella basal body P-ring formation protein FlgA|nr:flagellar basal body P-ring formation chaperone FlgA [Gemmatimonadaceae bacterium]
MLRVRTAGTLATGLVLVAGALALPMQGAHAQTPSALHAVQARSAPGALLTIPAAAAPGAVDARGWRPAPAIAQALVARVTRMWGAPPAAGWHHEWQFVRGDTAALDTLRTELAGSEASGQWTLLVRPVRYGAPVLVARLRVGRVTRVPVATRPLARGVVLAGGDVTIGETITWGRPAGPSPAADSLQDFAEAPSFTGVELRRVVQVGEAIRARDLAPAPLIQSGDTVTAEVVRDGVTLTLRATALRSAPVGARIPLRASHGRRLDGIVVSRSLVRLD